MNDNPFLAGIERQGELRGMHKVIFEMLEDRFGTVPDELQQRVRRVDEVDRLRTLRRNATLSDSLQAFVEKMDPAIASTGG